MKNKNILTIFLTLLIVFGLGFFTVLIEDKDYSDSERRALASFPELSLETIISGKFMSEVEGYLQDQFVVRDGFRTLKAATSYGIFGSLDNNKIFIKDGHLSKLEYPLNEPMIKNAIDKINSIYENHLSQTDANVYFTVIPDKNLYLLKDGVYLSMDYEKLFSMMQEGLDEMTYINVSDLLDSSDYYLTDTHWKQENIVDVADKILETMNAPKNNSFNKNLLTDKDDEAIEFEGVYYKQSAMPFVKDNIVYLDNEVLKRCEVYSYSTGKAKEIEMYVLEKGESKDGYELFLNGTEAYIEIVNPLGGKNRELVIFRDSFGSSLAPLLISNYSKVTLIDIRYMSSSMIGNMIEFDSQDVLFAYSTLVLNNSTALR